MIKHYTVKISVQNLANDYVKCYKLIDPLSCVCMCEVIKSLAIHI